MGLKLVWDLMTPQPSLGDETGEFFTTSALITVYVAQNAFSLTGGVG